MNKKRRKKKNRVWVREWIKKRDQLGALNNLVTELRDQDDMTFENFLRMKKVDFDYILETVKFSNKEEGYFDETSYYTKGTSHHNSTIFSNR
nr:unnamed protein product [Callosobruchus analis]